MLFVKLTTEKGDLQWINLDLIVSIDTGVGDSRKGKGSRLCEVGENPAIYIVRESPEEIFQKAAGAQTLPRNMEAVR